MRVVYNLEGLACASCAAKIEAAASRLSMWKSGCGLFLQPHLS